MYVKTEGKDGLFFLQTIFHNNEKAEEKPILFSKKKKTIRDNNNMSSFIFCTDEILINPRFEKRRNFLN